MESLPDPIRRRALERLAHLVAIPSVSAEGRGMDEAAGMVAALLTEDGFAAELADGGGAPVVLAERLVEGAPTVLFYNHYDVQPADPIEAWTSPPFELTERGGAVYGRGAADDKGELVSRLAALALFRERNGELPFGVKFVVEGEEEIGSPNLERFVLANRERLAADVALWEFGGVDAKRRPLAICGLKGILTVELRVRTAGRDLHSSFGAVVDNPIYRLAAALATLRDDAGRITIDGFYDDVTPPGEAVTAIVDAMPDETEALAEVFGVRRFLGGVTGRELHRQLYLEPTLNINGIRGGYGGPGAKTVAPAEAFAKLDFRLVPDQDPERLLTLLRNHLAERGFGDVEVILLEHAERAARSDPNHPWVQAAIAALREVHGAEPVIHPNSAGSGPIHPFVVGLGMPVVGIGSGYPGSRIHGPDEHMRLADFDKGTRSACRLLERWSGVG